MRGPTALQRWSNGWLVLSLVAALVRCMGNLLGTKAFRSGSLGAIGAHRVFPAPDDQPWTTRFIWLPVSETVP
jgi:hypothetical protein